MSLLSWNKQLVDQFSCLRDDPKRKAGGLPVFGLEHGLSPEELSHLETDLRNQLKAYGNPGNFWLPWVAFASELGYKFSGEEYWQTFGEAIPEWQVYKNREFIKSCFALFCQQYHGAKPSGRWGEHFKIISWPITNAILPKDLQVQLARILHSIRRALTEESLQEPSVIGKLVANAGERTTSRFDTFCSDVTLVGQIAIALLLEGHEQSQSVIHTPALERIIRDLDQQERQAGSWLREAQRRARNIRFGGLHGPTAIQQQVSRDLQSSQSDSQLTELTPRLSLRQRSDAKWELLLQIPNLSPLASSHPELYGLLKTSRCIIDDAESRAPIAPRKLVSGSYAFVLRRLPSSLRQLIRFEQSHPQEEQLLNSLVKLRPSTLRLFRIGEDGLGREVRMQLVRPEGNYVIVAEQNVDLSVVPGSLVDICCTEASGLFFAVPQTISPTLSASLDSLGLSISGRLNVTPAGVVPAYWNGEGLGEWLVDEPVCLSVSIDHPVREICLFLDDGDPVVLTPTSRQQTQWLIRILDLNLGWHRLQVIELPDGGVQRRLTGELTIVIREPQAWVPGKCGNWPLEITPTLPNASLEDLWEGKVNFDIVGPPSIIVSQTITLVDKKRKSPLVEKTLPPIILPAKEQDWPSIFHKCFHKQDDVTSIYDLASSCEVRFDAEELGVFAYSFERSFTPLRWAAINEGQSFKVRLVTDLTDQDGLEITNYPFSHANIPQTIDLNPREDMALAPEVLGLVVAEACGVQSGIIVPPVKVSSLSQLRCTTTLRKMTGSITDVVETTEIFERWAEAKIPGPLTAYTYRRDVLQALLTRIVEMIAGKRWINTESEYTTNPIGTRLQELAHAVSSSSVARGFRLALTTADNEWANLILRDRVDRFGAIIEKYLYRNSSRTSVQVLDRHGSGVSESNTHFGSVRLAELALRLSSDPCAAIGWAKEDFARGVQQLIATPEIFRAARYIVFRTSRLAGDSNVGESQLYHGWGW